MTDIVERLRAYVENIRGRDEPPENYLCWQAADEIERLRAEAATGFAALEDEIERLRAENEQLREALMDWPRDDGTAIAVSGEPGASAGKSE